ncbi:MAG: prenyltransferase, partial [Methanobacterium sp.]
VQNPELKIYAKLIGIGAMITSIFLAMIFTFIYSFPYSFILFVISGNLLGWFYAAPPIRLSYNGASEIATVLTGFIMPGMGYFSIIGTINLPFVIFSIPLMIYQFLFIIAVQIPDLEGDKLGNKRTLIVRKGRKTGFKLMLFSAVLGSLSLLLISVTGWYSKTINFFLIFLISIIPLSLAILSYIKRSEDRIEAINLVNRNLSSLFVFAIIINSYFVYLLL